MSDCPNRINGGCANLSVSSFLCDPAQCGKTKPEPTHAQKDPAEPLAHMKPLDKPTQEPNDGRWF